MTIMVTGAGGFIGRHIANTLEGQQRNHIALVRTPTHQPSELVCDLMQAHAVPADIAQDLTSVIHCASVLPSSNDADFQDNVTLTANLLQSLPSTLECLVLLSSISVYPLEQPNVDTDEACTEFTRSEYGSSKRSQETLVIDWGQRTGTRIVILRPSSVYGIGARPERLLMQMCRAAVDNTDITLFASQGYRQNFVSVHDVARTAVQALESDISGIFNLFSDDTLKVRQLAETITRVSGSTSRIVERPSAGVAPDIHFRNDRLRQAFQPVFHSLDEELLTICHHYRTVQPQGESA